MEGAARAKTTDTNTQVKQAEALRVRIAADVAALGGDVPAVPGSTDRLLAQALVTAALVEADQGALKAEGMGVLPDAPEYVRALREEIVDASGDAGAKRSEIQELTAAEQMAMRKIRAAKEQIVLLARLSPNVDHRAVNVNLGGTIAQTLSQVPAFLGLVRHSLSKFSPSERLPTLVKEVEVGLKTLTTLGTNQEMKKRTATGATRDVRRLAGLLFQTLSVLSWQYLHYADAVRRDAYRLMLVRPPGSAIDAASGDDEVVAPTPNGPRPVGEAIPATPVTGAPSSPA
ncbi:MAG: hypothetical protein HYY84_13505 [Deltaproteobacteria bacterium]|nr:hypothetical protein [Deltaproteobacteria bacterium]